jgi:putative DNA primase/helicase
MHDPRSKEELLEEIGAQVSEAVGLSAERPLIRLNPGGFALVAEAVEEALIASGAPVFRRGDQLVVPVEWEVEGADGERTLAVQFREISIDYLRELMDRSAAFEVYNARSKSWRPAKPPTDIAQLILARSAQWRFEEPTGIIAAPTIGPSGQLVQSVGFDRSTRLYLANPPAMPPMSSQPTPDDAARALDELSGLLCEFPFVDEASRSVALAAILTVVARGAFPLAPLFAASAPTPGSGKSLLWDVVAAIATGRACPVITPGNKTEELEKRIGSVFVAAQPLVSLDNMDGPLASSLLCQVLERPRVMIRLLGSSTIAEIPARTIWFATGNNLRIVDDLTRRCLVARLDCGLEEPEHKQFDGDPLGTVMRDRGRYVAAALCIVRAYLNSGSPNRLPRLGSYGVWSDLIRSALVWCGCADPCQTMRTARADDPSFRQRYAIFAAWPQASSEDGALTTAELVSRAEDSSDLKDGLIAVAPGGPYGGIDPTRLGKWLAANKDRIANGYQLLEAKARSGRSRWVVLSSVLSNDR